MEETIVKSAEELKSIVRRTYSEAATQERDDNASSCCGATGCGTGDLMMQGDDYASVPGYDPQSDLGLGCGIPTRHSDIRPKDTVLDLGSGAGNDVFIARSAVGEDGRVIGVDMTPAMIEKARANNARLGFSNVEFRLGEIERLPVASDQVDVVISNCVINLVPDKEQAYREIFRVLKPGGHFTISDVVLQGDLPAPVRRAAEMYAGCVSGAMNKNDYLGMVISLGFVNLSVLTEKVIEIPDEILAQYLTPEEMSAARASGVSVRSVTLRAEKPKDAACCGGGCCGA